MRTARADLPLAVGPRMTISVDFVRGDGILASVAHPEPWKGGYLMVPEFVVLPIDPGALWAFGLGIGMGFSMWLASRLLVRRRHRSSMNPKVVLMEEVLGRR